SQVPRLFEQFDLDAVVQSGDYEAGIAAVARWLATGSDPLPGVAVRSQDGWKQPSLPGTFLEGSDWSLPDVDEIPYAAYGRLYHDDQKKFCGIPDRRELVVPIARGCPILCQFCDVPGREGARERRLPVPRVISYIEQSFAAHPFEYVSMYAPTFTLHR